MAACVVGNLEADEQQVRSLAKVARFTLVGVPLPITSDVIAAIKEFSLTTFARRSLSLSLVLGVLALFLAMAGELCWISYRRHKDQQAIVVQEGRATGGVYKRLDLARFSFYSQIAAVVFSVLLLTIACVNFLW